VRRQNRRLMAVALLGVLILVTGLAVVPARSSAGSLSTGVIGMFPRQVGQFAYADLKSARMYSWFPQLREQLLPPRLRQFEQFLSSAGVDPNTHVEELAWGELPLSRSVGEDAVGVALGSFDPSSIEDRFKQQKLPSVEYRGYHLYANGIGNASSDILFTFLDSSTAAFGPRPTLEKLVDVRMGASESLLTNDTLFPLISEANGSGVFWAVLDKSYTHLAIQQLIPQAGQIRQAAAIINRMHAMMIILDVGSGMDARFQAVCDSVDDANLLGVALQAGVMYRRYQDAQTPPALAQVLGNIRVTPSGDRLNVEAPVSEEQLGALIKTKSFATPM
jgi:hypothetical protein